MASKYIALCEETVNYNTASVASSLYYKILSEDLNTTREDYFPETTEFWTTADKAEGFFRTSGSFSTLMHPLMWPKLLVLFIGDGGSVGAGGNGDASGSGYQHVWLFGANEIVATSGAPTGIKTFTTHVGQGFEKDRQLGGCFIESLEIECVGRQPVALTVNLIGSGDERLNTAVTPVYTSYTNQYSVELPYTTFDMVNKMEIGGTDNLTTAPIIEAFRLNLARGYDTDHYRLGSRYLGAHTLSGMASATGSMDLNFTSQDEHERFLTAVAGAAIGDQASFVIELVLRGAQIGSGSAYYDTTFIMSECYYTGAGSTMSISGRDRVIQTVTFRANYNSTDSAACKITCIADTQSYASLS